MSDWSIDKFHKEGDFYRSVGKWWEFHIYGFFPAGLGDLIYNTLRMIIETNDKSPWAYKSFAICSELLSHGKRWPDELSPPNIIDPVPYRSQFDMTRDPWIALYACAIHLDRKQFIEQKPPKDLYNPKVWQWRRALLGKRNIYRLLHKLSPGRRDYVKALNKLMWNAYKNRKT